MYIKHLLFLEKNDRWSKVATDSVSLPKAPHSMRCQKTEGRYGQVWRAAKGWDLVLLVKGDMLAAIFHYHLVLNPSKSVSLWQHTCATSYQRLWQRNSLLASVALMQRETAFVLLLSIHIVVCSDLIKLIKKEPDLSVNKSQLLKKCFMSAPESTTESKQYPKKP